MCGIGPGSTGPPIHCPLLTWPKRQTETPPRDSYPPSVGIHGKMEPLGSTPFQQASPAKHLPAVTPETADKAACQKQLQREQLGEPQHQVALPTRVKSEDGVSLWRYANKQSSLSSLPSLLKRITEAPSPASHLHAEPAAYPPLLLFSLPASHDAQALAGNF